MERAFIFLTEQKRAGPVSRRRKNKFTLRLHSQNYASVKKHGRILLEERLAVKPLVRPDRFSSVKPLKTLILEVFQ
ncbi:MAG: hypothetical protein A3B30_00445 [Candidatus Komeilibacteria bacterium RIFCSPLOWO2_01_FULL_52_15]|uniref:Uncharacterized protein n=1 Tax=Candidatus Komeilibacteria bacterium RIFCSPLOWO2_01_FULL_52_15 TaxID=1798551 RepID=A0A1G2BTW9_9BACT|nr:MAG: hypothetical protein A3B30_00445 [Candidatus Komeilibacteria bacterium RIFCSPLOWO2_01_FULL_52_15]